MATGFEAVGLKAVIDGLLGLFKKAKNKQLTAKGKAALQEAMHELLMAPTNLRSAEAKVRMAKAAGIISEDVEFAEELISKHKVTAKKKAAPKRAARKAPAKRVASKKAPARRP